MRAETDRAEIGRGDRPGGVEPGRRRGRAGAGAVTGGAGAGRRAVGRIGLCASGTVRRRGVKPW
ncbi:hypothetical protein GZL_01911 [Streptomyces sp. 769]|nr:hypothetical protein GZL_01911 [Streptomyces sp. 769]